MVGKIRFMSKQIKLNYNILYMQIMYNICHGGLAFKLSNSTMYLHYIRRNRNIPKHLYISFCFSGEAEDANV